MARSETSATGSATPTGGQSRRSWIRSTMGLLGGGRAMSVLAPVTGGAAAAVLGLAGGDARTARAQAPSPKLPEHVTPEVVRMIDRGLDYLAGTQRPDGSWSGSNTGQSYPCVMTGLAGLALMANGSTPSEGRYADKVRAAMNFLLNCAEKTKFIKNGKECFVISSESGSEMRSMYGHGFGMLFLAECYGAELDIATTKRLRRVLEGSARLITYSQSKLGGWYYSPESGGDEGSVTVTQMQSLRAARNAGIKVDPGTIEKAVKYLEISEVKEPDGTSGIAYMASQARGGGGGSRPPISAAAVVVLYSAGKYEADAFAKRCLEYTRRRWKQDHHYSGHWFYSHFYISQVFYQQSLGVEGRKDWREYYNWAVQRLRSTQAGNGSWNGDYVGTTYGTAIATLMLQLPYNYLPIFQR